MIELKKSSDEEIEDLTLISKRAFESDVEIGIDNAGGPPDYDNCAFYSQMKMNGILYSACENMKLIGGAVVYINENKEVYIGRIFIDPVNFRKGYGIQLMSAIEDMFPECRRFYLDTPIWNERTNSFYTKCGYKEIRRDENFVYYEKKYFIAET